MPASLFQSYTHKKQIQRKGAKFLGGCASMTIFTGTILPVPGDQSGIRGQARCYDAVSANFSRSSLLVIDDNFLAYFASLR
jgi:hypothetical protein